MISLTLDAVGARYERREILTAITLPTIFGGEVVAVIGPNAAGKSTLMRRVAGLVEGAGTVRIETGTGRAPRTCYMPQDLAAKTSLTVYEAMLLAVKRNASWRVDDATLSRVDAALRDVGIEQLAFRNLAELSGGQRQLVSLAQTLGREPDVMLLDEPTSALDLRHQFRVVEVIRRAARERGIVILVSIHDLNQALDIADSVLVVSAGRLAAFGEPTKVITPAFVTEVYGVTACVDKLDGRPFVRVQSNR